MTETSSAYQALAAALRERIEVVRDRAFFARDPAGHLARLRSVSETIVALQAQLPPPVDPQLMHYLQRCSYDKALAFIEERAA
ncbi:MAG: hypothetical protein QOE70_3140 [Chthoniobacter sp.]|jgi:hypothetical protein|nr:hypothetical protein [Chthoniobacter sp.]